MRFAADAMLGRLATWLRLLGYDTFYEAHIADRELAARARLEGRIILTRDRELTLRCGIRCLLINSDDIWLQLRQVAHHFELAPPTSLLGGRCARCNEPLHRCAPAEVAGQVPPAVWAHDREFVRCAQCGRIFWRGHHVAEIEARLRRVWEDDR